MPALDATNSYSLSQMQRLIAVALFLHILVVLAAGLPTEEEVDAVIERADASVRAAYREVQLDLAPEI